MAKMINTKYGYVTPQEAEIDAHLDKWMKRRAKQHGAFSLEKIEQHQYLTERTHLVLNQRKRVDKVWKKNISHRRNQETNCLIRF
jgi:peroxiredoxin